MKVNFVPKNALGSLGLSNKAVWTNTDSVPHSVTSDNNYKDIISGSFNSIDHIGLIPPGGKFTYVFTADGVYPYHCEPHPWMQGKVSILKQKFQGQLGALTSKKLDLLAISCPLLTHKVVN